MAILSRREYWGHCCTSQVNSYVTNLFDALKLETMKCVNLNLVSNYIFWLHLRPVYARAAERNDSFTRLKDCRSIAVALEANCHTLENKHVQDITKKITLRVTPIVDNLPIIVFYPSVLISFGFISFKHIVMLSPYHIPHVYICICMLIYVCM